MGLHKLYIYIYIYIYINKDHISIPAGELKFITKNNLDHLRSTAEDRTQLRRLSATIQEAAEASKSGH